MPLSSALGIHAQDEPAKGRGSEDQSRPQARELRRFLVGTAKLSLLLLTLYFALYASFAPTPTGGPAQVGSAILSVACLLTYAALRTQNRVATQELVD